MRTVKELTFDVQAAEDFGVLFRKLPWDVASAAEQYEITGEIAEGGFPVYAFKLIDGTKKRGVQFELDRVFIDETSISYIGADPSANTMRLAVTEKDLLRQIDETSDADASLKESLVEKLVKTRKEIDIIKEKLAQVVEIEKQQAFVGYDVETQAVPKQDFTEEDGARLVSHQFYLAHNGSRIGFIIVTNRRFTEKAFTKLITEIDQKHIKKVYVSAHYSLIECGWMIEDSMSKSEHALLFDAANYPRLNAAMTIEIDVIRKIINSVYDEAGNSSGRALGVDAEYADIVINADSLRISQVAKNALLEFKDREKAFKAVRCGYATYNIDEKKKVPALLISEHLRKKFRTEAKESVVIKKYKRTWAGTTSQLSKAKRDALNTIVKTGKDDWIKEFDKKELVGFYNTVLLSVMERNNVSNLRNTSAGVKQWNKAADLEACAGKRNKVADLEASTGKRKKIEPAAKKDLYEKNRPILIEFCDTMHFSTDEGKKLKSFGKMIGIPKLDLEDGHIEDMEKFLKDDPDTFYRYGIRDCVITAEALAFYGRMFLIELDTPFSTRITGYSRMVFRRVLKGEVNLKKGVYAAEIEAATNERKRLQAQAKLSGAPKIYGIPEENLKYYLGFERNKKKDGTNYWWPSVEMQLFANFYHGGWNDARVVGAYGPCTYFDLKSAYPCAIMMLSCDSDFSKAIVYKGDEAHKKAEELHEEDNPFQIAGVELSFEFRPDVEPIFPVRFDRTRIPNLSLIEFSEQLLYLRRGHTHIGWPELSVALKYKLLKDFKIHKLVTYRRLGGESEFAKEVEYLLRMRGEPGKKMIFKEILNFLYGMTATGIARKITLDSRGLSESKTKPGGLTCIPIAAYATSFCRAVMGELLACGNPAYAITTDGFISPQMTPLKKGFLGEATEKRLKSLKRVSTGELLNYEFIESDFVAKQSLFLKTRGYVLDGVNSKGVETVKMAKMGVQTQSKEPTDDDHYDPRVSEFLSHLIAGEYTKKSWDGFDKIKKNGANKPPIPTTRTARLSHTYDMKRVPNKDISESKFSYGGVDFIHPKFETAPLPDIDAFTVLRSHMDRNATEADYRDLLAKGQNGGFLV
jgi:hypothetical protein